jgi:hypothetical protein
MNVTDWWSFRAGNDGALSIEADTGATVTNRYKFFADDSNVNGTMTNNYGFYSDEQTGGTTNYGIVLGQVTGGSSYVAWLNNTNDGTTANQGIVFGSSQDTNLYRSAANTLTTDDSFTVGGTLTVGTAPTYTPSNVTTDRTFDANVTTINELADVVGTIIADLQTIGLFA